MPDTTQTQEDVTQTAPAQEATATATAGPTLTLDDLNIALQTIQVMAQRGAIRAEEMVVVGGLHDRLLAFLQSQGVLPATATTETATTETAVPEGTQGE